MVEYFRDGGFSMWILLLSALGTAGFAATRAPERRARVLFVGCILVVIEGVFGLSTGLIAVSSHYMNFPDKTAAIAEGLGELANNGTFSAGLALLLGIAALALDRRPQAS